MRLNVVSRKRVALVSLPHLTGVVWSTVSSVGGLRPLNDVTFGDGRFVAAGAGATVIASSGGDGAHWTRAWDVDDVLRRVRFVDGEFVGVGNHTMLGSELAHCLTGW